MVRRRRKEHFTEQKGKTFVRWFSPSVDFVCQQGMKKRGSWIFYKQTRKAVYKLRNFKSKAACIRAGEKEVYG